MAESGTEPQRAPAQYKQPSRKGKKAWRKNVDVSQVQTGLEDIRDEIIHGGVLAERPAEHLFTTDIIGEEVVKQQYGSKHKPLRSEQIIAQRSAVPAVDSRKRKSPEGISSGSSKRSKNGRYVSHDQLQRLKALANTTSSHTTASSNGSATYDPWAAAPAVVDSPAFPFLDEKKPARKPQTLSHPPISLASNGKPFAAVKKPQGGKSYNPAFEEWDALVTREGLKEVEAERKRQEDEKAEQERLDKAIAEAARPDPKSDDEYESAWESEWDGIQSEAEDGTLRGKRPERKSQSERNKMKKRKEAEAKAKLDKQSKKRQDQESRIREISKAVVRKERQRQLQNAVVDESDHSSDDEEVLRKKKFGKNPIPEAPLELVLADELQDSLRALRPEGNLLKDRFRNLLVNGKIEARRPITQPKKPKREFTEKWSYKDWKLR